MPQIKWFKGLLSEQKIPLLIVVFILTIGVSLVHQGLVVPFLVGAMTSGSTSTLMFFESAFAAHGQEITLTLPNSSFGSLSSGGGNQVSVFASYELNDNSIAGQTINAVMEVYAPNGSLIRTSSYPNGFIAQSSGGVEGLETTIRDPTLKSVTANVTFRNIDKTTMLSNDLRVDLSLAEEGTAPTTMTTEESGGSDVESPALDSESEQTPDLPQSTDEGESGVNNEDEVGASEEDTEEEEQDEGQQQLPLPLFGGG